MFRAWRWKLKTLLFLTVLFVGDIEPQTDRVVVKDAQECFKQLIKLMNQPPIPNATMIEMGCRFELGDPL
jgi:hypothetical protein